MTQAPRSAPCPLLRTRLFLFRLSHAAYAYKSAVDHGTPSFPLPGPSPPSRLSVVPPDDVDEQRPQKCLQVSTRNGPTRPRPSPRTRCPSLTRLLRRRSTRRRTRTSVSRPSRPQRRSTTATQNGSSSSGTSPQRFLLPRTPHSPTAGYATRAQNRPRVVHLLPGRPDDVQLPPVRHLRVRPAQSYLHYPGRTVCH